MKAALVLVAACGSDAATVDAGCADAAVCQGACPAAFTGNFVDHSLATTNCAALTPTLDLAVASPVIGSPLMISLDLGTPTVGPYSSESVTNWSAVQARSIGNGACVYSAGNLAVPTGSFALNLTDAAPHGTLTVELYVHAVDGTACGAGDNEQVRIEF